LRAVAQLGYTATLLDAAAARALAIEVSATEVSATQGNTATAPNVQSALDQAKLQGKLVILDFMAVWCGPCKKMLAETWRDPRLAPVLAGFIFVAVDTDIQAEVARQFGVSGLPDVRVLDTQGREIGRLQGFHEAEVVLGWLKGLHPQEIP